MTPWLLEQRFLHRAWEENAAFGPGGAKTCSRKPGVRFAPSASSYINLERTGTAGVGNNYAVQNYTDLLLALPARTMSLPFHREGVMRGEGCQFMTVLSTDKYC